MWPCPYNRRTDEQRFPGRDVVASPFSQRPISFQSANPLLAPPPEGNRDTTICPATPFQDGIEFSGRMAFMSLTTHCHWLLPTEVGFTSSWFSHTALYSQPGASWSV